nr:non ribosomal peptide synhtase [Aspergillus sp.]
MELLPSDPVLLLFNQSVLRYPDRTAVEDGPGIVLTYKELDEESTRLAAYLQRLGVSPADVVPILTTTCVQMVVGILGILKAGGIYVPVDHERCPQQRINYIMQKSQARTVIYSGEVEVDNNVQQVRLPLEAGDVQPVEIHAGRKDDRMAIIFTSGTTDHPKGVQIRSSSVARFVSSPGFNYDIAPGDRVLLVLSVGFDACLGTLFNTLCNAGTVVLANSMSLSDRARQCSVIVATPSIVAALGDPVKERYSLLSRIYFGGETPPQSLLEAWEKLQVSMWIAYGPTEATCAVLTGRLERDKSTGMYHPTRLGSPIPGAKVFLADSDMAVIEGPGQPGEICISGPCLSGGYLADEARTRERFILLEKRLVYRTGDIAQWTRTGNGDFVLDFCGREDRITKVRGFLVNLDQDVDQGILQTCPELQSAFSLMVNGMLCTAITSRFPVMTNEVLQRWRKAALPYTVPDRLVHLDSLPLNPNGKVDPHKLLDILESRLSLNQGLERSPDLYTTPEAAIFAWMRTELHLTSESIDVDRSSVALGVHSLGAMKLSAFCRQVGYNVSASDILTTSSLRELIAHCQKLPLSEKPSSTWILRSHLTPLQNKMFLETRIDPRSNYIQQLFHYAPQDIPRLKRAWEAVVVLEPVFRTVFCEQNGEIFQEIKPTSQFHWEELMVTTSSEVEQQLAAAREQAGFGSSFVVLHYNGPNLRPDECVLVWTAHRALLDGFSSSMLFEKVDCAIRGEPIEPSVPYTQAAADLESFCSSLESDAETFWNARRAEVPDPKGEFHCPEPPKTLASINQAHIMDECMDIAHLKSEACRLNVTPAAIIHAAWALVVSTYANSDQIIFGMVLSGRDLPFSWAPSIIGPLINQLPFTCRIKRESSISDFIQGVHRDTHRHAKFQPLNGPRDTAPFTTMLVVQDSGLQTAPIALPPLQAPTERDFTSLPLVVDVSSSGEIRLVYRTDRFTSCTIRDVGKLFMNLVNCLVNNSGNDTVQSCLRMRLPTKMQQTLLRLGNAHRTETRVRTQGETLGSLFRGVVSRTPGLIAVCKNGISLTYEELFHSASRVAYIIQRLVHPGDVVAVLADRSINWIIGIWAVVLSNAVYCPIDAEYTPEYQSDLLKQSSATLALLPNVDDMQRHPQDGPLAIVIGQILQSSICAHHVSFPKQDPSDVAYLCFTSGSTGVPKAFGGCVFEVFAALCYGSTLVLRKDDSDMLSHLAEVDATILTPSVAAELDASKFPNIRYVYFAGEPVTEPIVRRWSSSGRQLYNAYGSTEVSVMNTLGRLCHTDPICLGGAVPSSRLYILDDNLNMLPPNTIGQIFIGGVQVSGGYINMPERTEAEFVPDPFVEPGEQMYRTGDLGYFDHQGRLWYCSRKDRQVKIRGYRVNLDDIPHTVYTHVPSVHKAVAISRNNGIALVVTPATIDTAAVRAALQKALPPHYQPCQILALAQLPILKNGKIDLKGLADLLSNNIAAAVNGDLQVLPGTQNEVGDVLKQVLRLDSSHQLSASDNFFTLGGDSIAMLKLAGRLNEMFHVNVNIRDIFLRPTVEGLAAFVDQQRTVSKSSKRDGFHAPERLGMTVLSPPEMLWVHFHNTATCRGALNVPYHAILSSAIDRPRLVSSLEATLNRHRILRSRFRKSDDSYTRTISNRPISVAVTDDIDIRAWINKPFALNEALVRAVVTPTTFLLNISHILCDYGTLTTLLRDVEQSYKGEPIKPVSLEYFDEFQWRMPLQNDLTTFWDIYFEGIKFPRHPESRQPRSYNGTSLSVTLSGSIHERLLAAIAHRAFTFQQFGLSAVATVLETLGARRDLIIGCAYLNCPPESQDIVGLHLEPLPIRLRIGDDNGTSVGDVIRAVASSSESALAHSLPWHHLLSHLGLPFPSEHNEIFDCSATFHDSRGSDRPFQSIEGITPSRVWPEGAMFSIMFEWVLNEDNLVIRLAYDTDRFSSSFMRIVEKLLHVTIDAMFDTQRSFAELRHSLSQTLGDICDSMQMDVASVNGHSRKFLLGATST